MMVHSYKVEVLKLKTKIKALQSDLIKNPDNERAKHLLLEARDDLSWFLMKIDMDKDPGVRIE